MKYSELHRKIVANGWTFVRATGSHYFYEKGVLLSPPVPYHGSKEIGEGLKNKLIKQMGLR